jgi:hypothetical protein
MTRALGIAAAKKATGDPDLVDRAKEHWTRNLIRTQENRESVALRVVEILKEVPISPDIQGGPSDDFMNVFEDIAEKANSESLGGLLARTLAGEIRKPGTFSLRTLQFMATVDQPLADAIQKARHWITRGALPRLKCSQMPTRCLI